MSSDSRKKSQRFACAHCILIYVYTILSLQQKPHENLTRDSQVVSDGKKKKKKAYKRNV